MDDSARFDVKIPSRFRAETQAEIAQKVGEISAASYSSIQDAVDDLPIGGGVVRVTPGLPAQNVELRDGVYLVGANWGRGYLPADIGITEVVGAVEGPVIHAQDCRNCGVIGVNVRGLGDTIPSQGIVFENVTKGMVAHCMLADFTDEAIYFDADCGSPLLDTVQVTDALLDRTRAAPAGAVTILGTDPRVRDVEATASVTKYTVTDANLYCAAFLIGSTLGKYWGIQGELSDIGIYVSGNLNSFDGGCIADLNGGHGWYVTGDGNLFGPALSRDNSLALTNTYDNWHFVLGAGQNQTTNIRAVSDTAETPKARYGVNSLQSSANDKNFHINPFSNGATTGQYNAAASNGDAFLFAPGAQKTLTANSATPDVSGYTNFITANTAPTTITNFVGGVPGQRILVYCNDLFTTIDHNGSTISLLGAADKVLRRLAHYEFMFTGGLWREIAPFPLGVTADVGNAAKTLIARQNEETQIWNTVLTADRAVTLSTTGAFAGATFRIVRTAAATGAFNLNVGTGPLKALTAGQWCDVTYNGTAWVLTAFGSL